MVNTTETYDWQLIVNQLYTYLRLKTVPVGMKMFEKAEDMEAIPKIRRPQSVHTADQIVAQAARLGWTVGITEEDLVMPQCSAVLGLHPRDEQWLDGKEMAGIWFENQKDSAAHQSAMTVNPYGRHAAMAVSPLVSNRLSPPDICLIYATPGQMILLINGLQWKDYKKLEWGVVGESSCADSWGRALATGEPSLSIPCYAERRYGGVLDDEMLMALAPADLVKALEGVEKLSRNGLRYPIPQYGIQMDARSGLEASYGKRS
ncbi:hypothetical protein FQ087_02530 [Sporosarcina sp. ANT_H38]|uniref:DUF169 domain-containing protein n=1 Tax=Sporosarcina sp. ANT_H38 TaxID=2597358 RepID=UPI0011F0E1C6|nr:DUF169 domain-containing protein [Sporosarcina sp. ANT_H38]KAA0965206.1 hypothetical protein FQ087_02530 [Sporosarcina sp. ANT_H38]